MSSDEKIFNLIKRLNFKKETEKEWFLEDKEENKIYFLSWKNFFTYSEWTLSVINDVIVKDIPIYGKEDILAIGDYEIIRKGILSLIREEALNDLLS